MNTPNLDPAQEIERLKTVLSYNMLDTPYEKEFDELTRLLSLICNAPTAIISLIDDKRQWYKSKTGITVPETPLEETFCQHTILQDELVEISDARFDERVNKNPHVLAKDGIRFYAGMPLKAENGHNIGTVCVVDNEPKQLNPWQKEAVKLITNQAMHLFESKKKNQVLGNELEKILEEKVEKTRRQLRQKESDYKLLLDAIKITSGVVEYTPDGTIKKVNQQYLNFLGYTEEELIGKSEAILLTSDKQKENTAFWEDLKNGRAKSSRIKRLGKNRTPIWMQATYNPIKDLDQKVTGIIQIAQDISKEIEAVRAIKEAKNLAETLNIQKDNFIANVSHEIRTPIHAVLGFTNLLLDIEKEPEKKEYLQAVNTAGDSLLFLVNDILDLSKMEAGMLQIEHNNFKLRDCIHNVFAILKLKARQKNLDFQCEIQKNVPEQLIGDSNRLGQILINLLGNAIKFTEKGSVKLEIKATPKDNKTSLINFEVSDTGIGIPAEKLEHIFERFAQAGNNTAQKYGGTGLGLNISKQLIEKQNGVVSVKSIPGSGTSFTFQIPFLKDLGKREEFNKKLEKNTFSVENINILVCEDNELNQKLIKILLQEKGFDFSIAQNGEKALELIQNESFDLVLMDLQMPDYNGLELTEIFRNRFKLKLPIIALTANSTTAEKQKCLNVGMDDYLSKPFRKEDLFLKINHWLTSNLIPIAEKKTDSEKIIQLEILDELVGDNENFRNEMINLFISQTREMLLEIKAFFEKEEFLHLAQSAHKLKTSFGIIGANPEILSNLENIDLTSVNKGEIQENIKRLGVQIDEIFNILNDTNP